MSFIFVSKTFLKELNLWGYHYKHSTGLTLILLEDKNYNNSININITISTPAINNGGIAHIIEHCIASQSKNIKIIKEYASTFQDKTSYEYVLRSDDLQIMLPILQNIFWPEFKNNKNIFLREGWRLDEKNNQLTINGIMFNEIRDAFTSPMYYIINYIPYTLYNNSIYGNISGGVPEDILDISYDDVVNYHTKYYTLDRCCVFIHGSQWIENILETLSTKICEFPSQVGMNDLDRSSHVFQTYQTIPFYGGKYPSTFENPDGYNFTCINFATKKPQSQFEYNMYFLFCSKLLSHLNERYVNENEKHPEIAKEIDIIFKNSLYKPYLSILFSFYQDNNTDNLVNICTKAMDQVIGTLDKEGVPNFLLNRFKRKIDGLKLGNYVMEAVFSELSPFAYLTTNISEKEKEMFLEKIRNVFINFQRYSIITLSPYKENLECIDDQMIKKANEKGVVNEYSPLVSDEPLEINHFIDTNRIDTNSFPKKNSCEKPEIEKHDDIKYFLYYNNDEKVYLHIYFDISHFSYEELCLAGILNMYLNSCMEKLKTSNIVWTRCHPFYDKKKNLISLKFGVHLACYEKEFSLYLTKVIQLLSLDSLNKDTNIIKKMTENLKSQIDISLINNNILTRLFVRNFSYSSLYGYYKDTVATRGIGFYKFLSKIINSTDFSIKKLHDVSASIFVLDKLLISIYAKNKTTSLENVKEFALQFKRSDSKRFSIPRVNNKNEGFIFPIKLNYIAFGYNYRELGFDYSLKYEILCHMITQKYLIPILRNKYNAYGCGVSIIDDSLLFYSKEPNINPTLEVFKNTYSYIERNINTLYKQYDIYKYNYPYDQNNSSSEMSPTNDLNTIKVLYPNLFQESLAAINVLDKGITKKEIFNFLNMIEQVLTKNCYCVIGNEKILSENNRLFASMDYLLSIC